MSLDGLPESVHMAARAEFERARRLRDPRLQSWLDRDDELELEAPSEADGNLEDHANEKSRHEAGSESILAGAEEPIEPAGQPQEGGEPQHG